VFGAGVPLTPKYAAIRDARMVLVRGQGDKGVDEIPLSNSGLCLPNGTPANMGPVSHEYVFSPGRVTILLENSEIRRIWTDGRGHVPDEQSNPSFSGDSIGHWEGDTLVVDTTNLNGKTWLNEAGDVVSYAEHVVERFIPTSPDRITYRATVNDPLVYTRPWTIQVPLNKKADEVLEVACHEDNGDLQHLKDVKDEFLANQKKGK
jgi:hypothetical protein